MHNDKLEGMEKALLLVEAASENMRREINALIFELREMMADEKKRIARELEQQYKEEEVRKCLQK